jgi:predicted nuclease with TOPRIM domain
MSARATSPSPRRQAAAGTPGGGIVQEVLAERRELMIANERLRLELEELRGAGSREDPRLHVLELENRALREELAAVRDELAWFQDAVKRVVEEIEKASP